MLGGYFHLSEAAEPRLRHLKTLWPKRRLDQIICTVALLAVGVYATGFIPRSFIDYHEALRSFGLVIAAVGAGALASWRLYLTNQGQITERFTKAIDQLGAQREAEGGKHEPNLEVRLGGIYALERIAHDSKRDHWPIMQVLTAYVRESSPRLDAEQESDEPSFKEAATDIKAIMRVITNRTPKITEPEPLDLSGCNLQGAYLRGANLEEANLGGAYLRGANLEGANLEGADLGRADLGGANLEGAYLVKANLRVAYLSGANLGGTYLIKANLEGARLEEANLEGANLDGADLDGANLDRANLDRVIGLDTSKIDDLGIYRG